MIRCQPVNHCGQRETCARPHADGPDAIDASCSITRRQAWCPMFIDRRGAALIGLEIAMEPRITGRPRGDVSKAVEAAIKQSGPQGMTLDDLRKALPGEKDASIKYAAHNLRDRNGLVVLSSKRTTVYLSAGIDMKAAREEFAARLAAIKAEQKARAAAVRARYFARYKADLLEVAKLRRAHQKEQAERIRAEHRAKVEQAKADRQAQREAEAAHRAKLHASKRAEIAANNRLAKRIKGDGTHDHAAAVRPEPVAPTITWGAGVKHTIVKAPPGRYEVLTAPPTFTGKELLPPASCAARALS